MADQKLTMEEIQNRIDEQYENGMVLSNAQRARMEIKMLEEQGGGLKNASDEDIERWTSAFHLDSNPPRGANLDSRKGMREALTEFAERSGVVAARTTGAVRATATGTTGGTTAAT